MSTWTSDELDALAAATELRISTRRPDGTLRPAVPIWVVRAGSGSAGSKPDDQSGRPACSSLARIWRLRGNPRPWRICRACCQA
jgi:hypothetical protein